MSRLILAPPYWCHAEAKLPKKPAFFVTSEFAKIVTQSVHFILIQMTRNTSLGIFCCLKAFFDEFIILKLWLKHFKTIWKTARIHILHCWGRPPATSPHSQLSFDDSSQPEAPLVHWRKKTSGSWWCPLYCTVYKTSQVGSPFHANNIGSHHCQGKFFLIREQNFFSPLKVPCLVLQMSNFGPLKKTSYLI